MANWKQIALLEAALLCLVGCGALQPQEPSLDFDRLPLEAFRLDHKAEAAFHRAEALLIRTCMTKAGFEWRTLSAAWPGPDPRRRRYGVADADIAQRYGYHPPAEDQQRFVKAIEAEQELFLQPGAEEAYSGPEGSEGQGCAAQARERLTDGADDVGHELFSTLDERSLDLSERRPAVRAATRAWRDCMRERGYSSTTPRDAVADDWGLETPVPSRKERAVAGADVACKEKTSLTRTWLREETSIQRSLIAENASYLAGLKKANDVYQRNVRAAMAEPDRF
ncbi:hypothetical protein [Streptomyces acidicola]|uniref:hypothetical protein n=1 Tax=Streptomyces acidicola TaxID=2596892 RepID=UPI0037FA0693